jgi:hypothetical protein
VGSNFSQGRKTYLVRQVESLRILRDLQTVSQITKRIKDGEEEKKK